MKYALKLTLNLVSYGIEAAPRGSKWAGWFGCRQTECQPGVQALFTIGDGGRGLGAWKEGCSGTCE